jgi:hypothetical protein
LAALDPLRMEADRRKEEIHAARVADFEKSMKKS